MKKNITETKTIDGPDGESIWNDVSSPSQTDAIPIADA